MTNLPKVWKFSTLPKEALEELLPVRVLGNAREYREDHALALGGSLFEAFDDEDVKAEVQEETVIWATDSYEGKGKGYGFSDPITKEALLTDVIKPRVEKSQVEQKARVKAKAEVFTPMWVCNLQNNLIDDEVVGPGAFNSLHETDQKVWIPSTSPVEFSSEYRWQDYVTSRRLEMAAGEAPYLMSPYDATTGTYLPVRNTEGHFQRIGILDRKLRVVSEQVNTFEEWEVAAKIALKATYGYEWQGDNLMLARLNMVNTYFDYLVDFVAHVQGERFTEANFLQNRVAEVAAIASWQLWQMDGLKQVLPLSCPDTCGSCKKNERVRHEGRLPLVKWGATVIPFEDFLLQ